MHLMWKTLTLALALVAGGVLLRPLARGTTSYSEGFTVEGLFGSATQTFSTSDFAPYDHSQGTLIAIGVDLTGTLTLENALVGESLEITIPGMGIIQDYENESETPGTWVIGVNIGGIDHSPSDASFYSGLTAPIEIEVQLADTNSSAQIFSAESSLSGTWTWYSAPEPNSMLPVAVGLAALAGLLGWKNRLRWGRDRD